MMRQIGGFFELELKKEGDFHASAFKVNTGRNAFEYILKTRKYNAVHLPYYICNGIIEPLLRNNIHYKFYAINEEFRPVINFSIKPNEGFLCVNYFGINDDAAERTAQEFKTFIGDYTQAFFSKPNKKLDTFYSARKFFGVPDGGYVYTAGVLDEDLAIDVSYDRFEHLVKRIDVGAPDSYPLYRMNEERLMNQPIKAMSVLTRRILCSIDYHSAGVTRRKNFAFLHDALSALNEIKTEREQGTAPMVYPFMISKEGLREFLTMNGIYTATYWKEVLQRVAPNSYEAKLSKFLVPLPIDQRYGLAEMKRIVGTVNLWRDGLKLGHSR